MMLATDTETARSGGLLCTSWYWQKQTHVDWGSKPGPILRSLLRNPKIPKVFHNGKFDLQVLEGNGISVNGELHDTMALAKCLDARLPSFSLKHLMYCFLGDFHLEQLAMTEWFLSHGYKAMDDMALLPKEIIDAYTRKDVEGTFLLWELLWPMVQKEGLVKSYETERGLIRPVAAMERNPLLIDRKWVRLHYANVNIKAKGIYNEMKGMVDDDEDFNPNSIPQVTRLLMLEGFALEINEKGNAKFDKAARAKIDHPLAKLKSELSVLTKTTATYCKNLIKATETSPLIFPNFQISEAVTRRFSSRGVDKIKINWQNFPEEMRRCLLIPKGKVGWFFDYKQIENIIHIYFTQDAERRAAYEADENWSEYIWLAERILGEKINKADSRYKRIKSVKLGMNYGLGARKFATMNGIPFGEAREHFNAIQKACPAIKQLHRDVGRILAAKGFVTDPFGYRYWGDPEKGYKVTAWLVQGCAAALMKEAIIQVSQIEGVTPALTIHDELFFLTDDDSEQWARAKCAYFAMTNFSHLFSGIPIRVETCRSQTNWLSKEKVEL